MRGIAEATQGERKRVERSTELIDRGAHQNRAMVRLTIANVVITAVAVAVSAATLALV